MPSGQLTLESKVPHVFGGCVQFRIHRLLDALSFVDRLRERKLKIRGNHDLGEGADVLIETGE